MKLIAQALGAVALVVATAGANVGQAATVNLNSAVLSGGASLIANDGRIMFDPNIAGETATFTIPSIPGTQYSIEGRCSSFPSISRPACPPKFDRMPG